MSSPPPAVASLASELTKSKKKKSKSKDATTADPAADPPSLAEAEEKTDGYMIKPQSLVPSLDTSTWPLLLKNYDRLNVRTGHYTPFPSGHSPLKRPLAEYLRYGVINLDKWSSDYDVRTILLSIQSLLGEPNNDSPLNTQAAALWANHEEFRKMVEKVYKPT